MEASSLAPTYLTVVLQVILLIERIVYWGIVWMAKVTKSSCTGSLSSCCKGSMDITRKLSADGNEESSQSEDN